MLNPYDRPQDKRRDGLHVSTELHPVQAHPDFGHRPSALHGVGGPWSPRAERKPQRSGNTARLFFAIEMDAESRQMLAATVEQMRQLLPPKGERYVRWTAPENLHVTLKFLGETPDGEVASLIAKAQEMLVGQTAFLCRAYAVRAFLSSRGPSILRTEVEGGLQLIALAGELERALESLGYERERRAFVGHVTLGRIRDPGAARSVLEVLGQYPLDVPFTARHVTLFQSELTPRGPIYTALRRIPLANEPGPDSPMSGGAAVAPDADTHVPQHKENDNGG